MEVYEVNFKGEEDYGNKKYVLIDKNGEPVVPVIKYLKHLDNTGKSSNTLKTYCYHLKLYFEFLEQSQKEYDEADFDLMSKFVGWLQTSPNENNVISMSKTLKKKRKISTVNAIITAVNSFYEHLMRLENYEGNGGNMTEMVSSRFMKFKPFLHHISKGKPIKKNLLKLKEPKSKIKVLTNEQVSNIQNACTNIRDELLIRILYEGGLRIQETLDLWLEDFNISNNSIIIKTSKTTSGENRLVYVSAETMNLFQDYLFDIHDAEGFDTNYVFVKLSGKNKGKQLDYSSVMAFIKRLRDKTNVSFTPHTLRHTCATELHENGVDAAIIKNILGHKHVQTTIDLYIHPSDKLIRKEYEKAQENKKGMY